MSQLKQKDKELIWHPFNQMKGADILPITHAKGVYLYDEEGKEYIDAFSSWWVNVHGPVSYTHLTLPTNACV